MAATSTLLRLNKSPLHALIQKHLLRPSLAAGTSTKLFDISADSRLPTPNSALSQPLIGAVFQPTWNLPFGMSMEHSRMEERRCVCVASDRRWVVGGVTKEGRDLTLCDLVSCEGGRMSSLWRRCRGWMSALPCLRCHKCSSTGRSYTRLMIGDHLRLDAATWSRSSLRNASGLPVRRNT
nr:hypothetical protein Itr_chr14CG18140 [Ipomoea trifida]